MNQRKKARQERAAARQAERDARSTKDQILLIEERRGKSSKEFIRLWKSLSVNEQNELANSVTVED